MAISKITNAERDEVKIYGLPDKPGLSKEAMQQRFDGLGNLAIDKINEVIDSVNDSEKEVKELGDKVDQFGEGQIPEEYVQSAVETYVNNNQSELATKKNLEELDNQLSSEIADNEDMLTDLSNVMNVSKLDNMYKNDELITDGKHSDNFYIWLVLLGAYKTIVPGKYIGVCEFDYASTGANEVTSFVCELTLGYGLSLVNQGTNILKHNPTKHGFGKAQIASVFEITEETIAGIYARFASVTPSSGAKEITFTVNKIALLPISDNDDTEKIISTVLEEQSETYFVPYIAEAKTEMETVLCFGDSLTMGAGGDGTTYPIVLQNLLGENYEVKNYGVGGETAQQIAGRQGGVPIIVQPPLNLQYSAWSNINLLSVFGSGIGLLGYQSGAGLTPCSIDGVSVTMYWDSENKQTARTTNSGETLEVSRPTILVPYSSTLKGTLIVWSGTNGWGDNDVNTLVEMQKRMIEYNGNEKYIVVGIHSVNRMDVWESLEKAQTLAFGHHYINIRDYLVNYGLDDVGLEPTEEDITMIAEGKVPNSLMVDGIHFTAEAYTVIANVIYKRGKELGLW